MGVVRQLAIKAPSTTEIVIGRDTSTAMPRTHAASPATEVHVEDDAGSTVTPRIKPARTSAATPASAIPFGR